VSRLAAPVGVTGVMARSTGSNPPGALPPARRRTDAARQISEVRAGRALRPVPGSSEAKEAPAGAKGESELRDVVDDAWEGLAARIDDLLGSGRLLDRGLVVELARFLDQAGPAVDAYEQLLARVAAAGEAAGEG
jgi:hypothetical protein